MENMQNILPVTKAKRELLEILKVMEEEDSTIALTRNGQAVGIMMTPGRYDALLETIWIVLMDGFARARFLAIERLGYVASHSIGSQ